MPDIWAFLPSDSEGMELYIVDPARLGFRIGDTVLFAEVTEAARDLSYTALGYCEEGSRGGNNSGGTMQVLAPHARQEVRIGSMTKLIILAEEWE